VKGKGKKGSKMLKKFTVKKSLEEEKKNYGKSRPDEGSTTPEGQETEKKKGRGSQTCRCCTTNVTSEKRELSGPREKRKVKKYLKGDIRRRGRLGGGSIKESEEGRQRKKS